MGAASALYARPSVGVLARESPEADQGAAPGALSGSGAFPHQRREFLAEVGVIRPDNVWVLTGVEGDAFHEAFAHCAYDIASHEVCFATCDLVVLLWSAALPVRRVKE